jgi:hypothetical protein
VVLQRPEGEGKDHSLAVAPVVPAGGHGEPRPGSDAREERATLNKRRPARFVT